VRELFFYGRPNQTSGGVQPGRRRYPRRTAYPARLLQRFAQFLDAAGDGVELHEMALAFNRQEPRERGFARTRRAVENHRAKAIGLEQPPQRFPFAEEMPLPGEFVERPRPHPRRQRFGLLAVFSFGGFEEARHGVRFCQLYCFSSRILTFPLPHQECRFGLRVLLPPQGYIHK